MRGRRKCSNFVASIFSKRDTLMNNFKAVPSGSKAIRFTKMHGLGNDYVYILLSENSGLADFGPEELSRLARRISHRHFGVGGDGMVIIAPSREADFKMRMWNADGSEAQMCGNASRCVGKFVFDSGLTSSHDITLDTLAGIKRLHLHVERNEVQAVTVDMGEPELQPSRIPVVPDDDDSVPATLTVSREGAPMRFTAVSMGNPHGVCFVPEITDSLVLGFGPEMENHPAWPQKANIEFARVIDRSHVEMRVWERGTGETMACGTGACATAVAAVLQGLADRKVSVQLPGGSLLIEWDEASGHVFMTGPATITAAGTYFHIC